MCHLILLHQIITINIILFFSTYCLCSIAVNNTPSREFITDHNEAIQSKFKVNDEIIIIGVLTQNHLYLDLRNNNENMPFHLKSERSKITLNSLKGSNWQSEIVLTPNPLVVNASFMIRISIDKNEGFNVAFNEIIFMNFSKREPIETIKLLRLYGNFTLQSIKIVQGTKEGEDNAKKTLIMGIAMTFALIVIIGMGVFYILRKRCVDSNSKTGHDPTIESVGSQRSEASNMTHLTVNSFLEQ